MLQHYANVLAKLHERFMPHPGQIPPGTALFKEGVRRVFLRFGRQTGKSYLMAYIAVRWALTHPDSRVFIMTPFLNQTRELYLHSGLVERMIPLEFLAGEPHKTDGRFSFTNGAQIKLLGADNAEAARGLTADLFLIDEVKDVADSVISIIKPTLLVRRAPLVIAGTPPDLPDHPYWAHVHAAENDPDWRIYHLTSYDNPYIDKADIDKERAAYDARGDLDVFKREYLAEYCPGQKRMVFPMLDNHQHVVSYDALRAEIYRKPHAWDFYVAMDPGTASTFAVLLVAVNHYQGKVRVMDEVYITQQAEISIGQVWPKVQEKMKELWDPEGTDSEWSIVCDEAATWARVELLDRYDLGSWPTEKSKNRKSDGLSLIKDLLLESDLLLSDRCVELVREMRSYVIAENGQVAKKNDHAIDCLRYSLGVANFSVQHSPVPERAAPAPEDERPRAFTPAQDMRAYRRDVFGDEFDAYLFDELDDVV